MMIHTEQKPIELVLRSRDQRIVSTLFERNIDVPVTMSNLSPVRAIRFSSCIPIGVHIEQPIKGNIEDQPGPSG